MEINNQLIEALKAALQVVIRQKDAPPQTSEALSEILFPPPNSPSADLEQKRLLEDVLQKFLSEEAGPVAPEEVIHAMESERPLQKPWFTGHMPFPQKPFYPRTGSPTTGNRQY